MAQGAGRATGHTGGMRNLLLAVAVFSLAAPARAGVKSEWVGAISNALPRPTTDTSFGRMMVRLPRFTDPAERDAVMMMIAGSVKAEWAKKYRGDELTAAEFAGAHSDDAKKAVARAIMDQMEKAEAEAKEVRAPIFTAETNGSWHKVDAKAMDKLNELLGARRAFLSDDSQRLTRLARDKYMTYLVAQASIVSEALKADPMSVKDFSIVVTANRIPAPGAAPSLPPEIKQRVAQRYERIKFVLPTIDPDPNRKTTRRPARHPEVKAMLEELTVLLAQKGINVLPANLVHKHGPTEMVDMDALNALLKQLRG